MPIGENGGARGRPRQPRSTRRVPSPGGANSFAEGPEGPALVGRAWRQNSGLCTRPRFRLPSPAERREEPSVRLPSTGQAGPQTSGRMPPVIPRSRRWVAFIFRLLGLNLLLAFVAGGPP